MMRTLAAASEPFARALRFTPLVTKGQLSLVLWSVDVDAEKAKRELGFRPTPLSEGVRTTIDFLRAERLVQVT
jgi:nucleoside-diphosphate-sugar epimerase